MFSQLLIQKIAAGCVLSASYVLFAAAIPARAGQSQTPAPRPEQKTPPPAQAPEAHKIWLNEDLVALRTPSDVYVLEKEAQRTAEQAAKLVKPDASGVALPETIEETQNAIATSREGVSQNRKTLARLMKELAQSSGDQERAKQKEIDRATADLLQSEKALKALQDNLETLQNKTAAPPPRSTP